MNNVYSGPGGQGAIAPPGYAEAKRGVAAQGALEYAIHNLKHQLTFHVIQRDNIERLVSTLLKMKGEGNAKG